MIFIVEIIPRNFIGLNSIFLYNFTNYYEFNFLLFGV